MNVRNGVAAVARGMRLVAGQATRGMRTLPDFLVVGTQKGGTTSLYNYLIRHPRVARAATKEVHFFDRHFHRGADWYRGHFPSALRRAVSARLAGSPLRTLEASPCYLMHGPAPRRVAALMPEARIVVLLRDPVARAYSHYNHRVSRGVERRSFAAVVEEELAAGAPFDLPATDAEWDSCRYKELSVLSRGMYLEQLLRWEACIPPERLLVLTSEELSRHTPAAYARILEFLGLPPAPLPTLRRYNEQRPAPIDPALRERLLELYAEPNERLRRHLGRDLEWPRPEEALAGRDSARGGGPQERPRRGR